MTSPTMSKHRSHDADAGAYTIDEEYVGWLAHSVLQEGAVG